MFLKLKTNFHYVFFIVFVLSAVITNAQKFYNKDVNALIKIDKKSEFSTFSASAENLKNSSFALRYEFIVFDRDIDGNTSKSIQGDRFYLASNEKKILSSVTINNNIIGKVIIVLFIYPIIDGDDNVGAIGKDRIELTSNANGQILIKLDPDRKVLNENTSGDLAKDGQDGVFLQGMVLHKTITKSGRDFHRYFYTEYFNKDIKTDKNIVIKEVPGQRRSTRISVELDGQLVWQFFANPKKKFLKDMASRALRNCVIYLQQLAKQKETLKRY